MDSSTSYEILFFLFKNDNVKMEVDIIVFGSKLTI